MIEDWVSGAIENLLKSIINALKNWILDNLASIMQGFDNNLATISETITQTPESFNPTINSLIHVISDTAVLPIGCMIITFVSCYEIIQMLMSKNNGHEIEMYDIWKVMFKMGVGVYILNNCYEITMSFFDVSASLTTTVSGLVADIAGATSANWSMVASHISSLPETGTTLITLVAVLIITFILKFAMFFISMYCLILVYSRFIETYIVCSVAPIPFATMINRDWGVMGKNYVMNLMALAFQTFFMMVICGMYIGLMQGFTMVTGTFDIYYALLGILGSTFLLALSLKKTREISIRIFAH